MEKKIYNFYELDVWKKAHELGLNIYKITKNFPKEELFGITSQLKRAINSVTANIAEGFERYYFKDKIKFYYQARGSLAEVQNFLLLAKDLGLINLSFIKI
jgi:four helix bundle protein